MDERSRKKLVEEIAKLVARKPANPRWKSIVEAAGNGLFEKTIEATSFLDMAYGSGAVRFGTRLACVVNRTWEIPVCERPGCEKKLDLRGCKLSQPFPKHCCPKCAALDEKTDQLRKQTKKKKYGSEGWSNHEKAKQTIAADPDFWKKRDKKTKATKLVERGSGTWTNVAAARQTKLERYGNPDYSNRQKASQTMASKTAEEKEAIARKRKATLQKRIEADPELAGKIQAKSVATRKKNHGEDYTGREKCKKTCVEKYGVENPWQSEAVKEAMKQANFVKYGVEYYSSTAECRAKVAATCLERYGNPAWLASEDGKEATKRRNLAQHGVEHCWQREDVRAKIRETNVLKRGYPFYTGTEEGKEAIRRTSLARYGVDHPWQSEEVKAKTRATNRERFGVDFPVQNPEWRRKQQKRYEFEGTKFDSAPELAFYIWLRDSGIEAEYQPDVAFEYEARGKKRVYQPDFRVGDLLFELKGDHFFVDGKMVNPWDRSQDDVYEAKYLCMLANGVVVVKSADYEPFVVYVEQTYGRGYLKSFKNGLNQA